MCIHIYLVFMCVCDCVCLYFKIVYGQYLSTATSR
uniref:Uncharacterized protein n=1 Tax=Anguilla anguilla TaxID=7936 RepID=A0A0E9RSU8_ANGAN